MGTERECDPGSILGSSCKRGWSLRKKKVNEPFCVFFVVVVVHLKIGKISTPRERSTKGRTHKTVIMAVCLLLRVPVCSMENQKVCT